jgi:TRAP-type transport system periplasmic protein
MDAQGNRSGHTMRARRSVRHKRRLVIGIGATAVLAVLGAACSTASGTSNGATGGTSNGATGGTSSGTKSQADAKSVTITYGASNAPDDPNAIAMTTFAKEVSQLTNGSVKVNVRPNGVLGNTQAVTNEAVNGTIQMVLTGTDNLISINPEVGVLSLPFIFPNYAAVDKALAPNGVADEVGNDLRQKNGVIVLAWQEQGFVQLLTKTPIKTLAQLQGLKIRATQDNIVPVVYSSVGAQPTSVDESEVFTALSTGTVDGIGNPNVSNYAHQLYQVAKNLTISNIWWIPDIVVINEKFYDSLSSSQQQALNKAAKDAAAKEITQIRAEQQQDQDTMVSKDGVHVYTMSQADLATWKSKLAPLYAKYEQQFPAIMKALGFNAS